MSTHVNTHWSMSIHINTNQLQQTCMRTAISWSFSTFVCCWAWGAWWWIWFLQLVWNLSVERSPYIFTNGFTYRRSFTSLSDVSTHAPGSKSRVWTTTDKPSAIGHVWLIVEELWWVDCFPWRRHTDLGLWLLLICSPESKVNYSRLCIYKL